ncbi:MAG: helix-turn-helix domain-containing protein [Raineya sp.]|jgi:hypothetical protein|nr:helix-turn-helix domain-containing protein [Raineya sp.]
MEIAIITKTDLLQFKAELLSEIKEIVKPDTEAKTWLKSAEVRKQLSVSPGTLQNLRINGTLNYTKVGGTFYYRSSDINRLMEEGYETN